MITTALSHTIRHRLNAVLLRVGAAGRVVPFHREIALGAIDGDHERNSRSTGRARQRWHAPTGHSTQKRVFIDPDLLQYDEVCGAAGTWNDVFAITPADLRRASGGTVTELKRG